MFACSSAVTYPWLATLATCVEFAPHPPNKTAVLYSDLTERVDGFSGDVDNLPVTRHVEEEEWKNEVKMGVTYKVRDLFKRAPDHGSRAGPNGGLPFPIGKMDGISYGGHKKT